MEGARIELKYMKKEPEDVMYAGLQGTFKGYDDRGHLLMEWDNGSTLPLLEDEDKYTILDEE